MWMVIRQPGITTGGKTYDLVHAGTSNAERTKLGGTWFHHTALGLASTTTNGVDTGKRTHTYAYGPTGLPRGTTTEAVPQPYRYAGTYQDPTGLYKMGHRYYDPALGRFTQPDPSGQETNPYLYASGDPINNSDPTGLFGWPDVGEGLGGFAGGVLGVVATATVCSTGVGCLVGGAILTGLGTGSGAAIGSALLGGSNEDRSDAFMNGALWGTLGATPAGSALGRWLG